ncbi:LytTR family DNA-binding domain-containing protein [Streptococcus loxodontisalivarius]|uniref:DNA-binding LytR/AlgR family response regulator n=1 Tax=Streptococcus loxodontisalivarius TaxID=1349415 RepID=A0ABS2PS21_9STRE|nr:LytTR family DNA-binding domain-containing protein [Streptococcus loxodontisalivarius]MBM7642841.1 DNA-binding LytR/AlgR family response regulator [Streptococcus loxodontisalivarius]
MRWLFIEDSDSSELEVLLRKRSQDEEVLKLIRILEDFGDLKQDIIAIKSEDAIELLRLEELIAVDVEAGSLVLTSSKGRLVTKDRLYQFKERYLSENFVQVSKQTIINIHYLERMEASFSGNRLAYLSNGYKTSVSRRYLKALEKALGL